MKNSTETNSYIIGFILSLLLTFAAYFCVVNNLFGGQRLVIVALIFALLQVFVQLSFWLHLWKEKKPRWNLLILLSTLAIILTVVLGSLWIMNNLNYRHAMEKEIQKLLEEGKAY